MQIRTATSCLYATAEFLNFLPKEHIENIENQFKSLLLTNSIYWKLNKHPTPSVCLVIYFKNNSKNMIFNFYLGSASLVYFIIFYIVQITKIFTR